MKRLSLNSFPMVLVATLAMSFAAQAYPEFQKFVVTNSKRPVNCAMCHANADGPEGTAPGQIGRLNAAEQERLGRARAAFQPGQNVDSPILNAFGNHIIKSVGKQKFLEIKLAPAQLAEALPKDSDLDHDGIPDVREYLDGTHPVNRNDGNPWLLFKYNFQKNLPQIALALVATIAGMWGLSHLLHGFAVATRLKEETAEESEA
jgi:hypothetical protein